MFCGRIFCDTCYPVDSSGTGLPCGRMAPPFRLTPPELQEVVREVVRELTQSDGAAIRVLAREVARELVENSTPDQSSCEISTVEARRSVSPRVGEYSLRGQSSGEEPRGDAPRAGDFRFDGVLVNVPDGDVGAGFVFRAFVPMSVCFLLARPPFCSTSSVCLCVCLFCVFVRFGWACVCVSVCLPSGCLSHCLSFAHFSVCFCLSPPVCML